MLTIVIPTYNEAESLPPFLQRIRAAMGGGAYEIIVVDDDSPDQTWSCAERLRSKHPMLRVIRRMGRRGLSSAVMEGCAAATGGVVAVMDADGQHDPAILSALVAAIEDGAGIAIASRYAAGGSTAEWVRHRRLLSRWGTALAALVTPCGVTDPLSGYFAIRTDLLHGIRNGIRPVGFKILLEILAALPRTTIVREVPLAFQARTAGESKLTARVQVQFMLQLLRLLWNRVGGRITLSLFMIACVSITFLLIPRIIALLPLYFRPEIRQKTEAALRAHAEREGLLLSSILIDAPLEDRVRVTERRYRRGPDETRCMLLPYDFSPAQPCAK